MINTKKNTFELFGFDYLIDDEYNAWLIEINASPSMEPGTKITQEMTSQVMEDTMKVMVDWYPIRHKKKRAVQTGGFKCICSNGKPYH
mmetsp:Transcript_34547/g.31236  ORF Transcript_34547/g.31236 Transcript_34547/m.31236 type:complete len:88 (-) Transcript_34547:11-274(-)